MSDILASQLPNAVLPQYLLPLLEERRPYLPFSDAAIQSFLRHRLHFPESAGRLSAALGNHAGVIPMCPSNFEILEAHLDFTRSVPHLENALVSLGFEPDHFMTLNPIEYRRCFTLKFELDRTLPNRRERSANLRAHLLTQLTRATKIIAAVPNFPAYAEAEVYTAATKTQFQPFRSFCERGIGDSPLTKFMFTSTPLPQNDSEWGGKSVDIHIKLPTPDKGPSFTDSDNPRQMILAAFLRDGGCYEITSYSGNRIFTVQLSSARGARRLYSDLCRWAATYGGISSIYLEHCLAFWHRIFNNDGTRIHSPVPPVMEIVALGHDVEGRYA